MSQAVLVSHARAAGAHIRPRRARSLTARLHWLTSWTFRRVTVALIAVAGMAVLLYPMTANWFNANSHAATVQTYAKTVAQLPAPDIQAALDDAAAYNARLPVGGVTDPFSAEVRGAEAASAAYQSYEGLLNFNGDGLMGVVNIPAIGVHLPIYHGTTSSALNRGVGHLNGSALPVGGVGTHTVLTGHSGIAGDTLFSHLPSLALGDTFTIVVLDRVLTYRVDQILNVLPTEIDALSSVPGEDYASLVTCTPIGINSHRLLVRGVRVPMPVGEPAAQPLLTHIPGGGFPTWALLGLGGVIGSIILTAPLAKRSGTTPPRRRGMRARAAHSRKSSEC